jgi:hypothetical protein
VDALDVEAERADVGALGLGGFEQWVEPGSAANRDFAAGVDVVSGEFVKARQSLFSEQLVYDLATAAAKRRTITFAREVLAAVKTFRTSEARRCGDDFFIHGMINN